MRAADISRERPAWWALAASAVAAFLLHIPFLSTPLSVDEGGYGYVAHWWARGADLYGDVWVDRPQGLLLLYRWALALPGSDALRHPPHGGPLVVRDRGRPRSPDHARGGAARGCRGGAAERPALERAGDRGLHGERRADGDAAGARRASPSRRAGMCAAACASCSPRASSRVRPCSSSSRATTAASPPGIWLLLAAWRGWRPAGDALRALARARARRRPDRRRRRTARCARRASTTGGSRSRTTASRSRAWPRARSSERFSLFTDSLRTAGPVVGALAALAAARPVARAAAPRDGAPGDLVRALADRASRSAASSTGTTTSGR